ncbi:MAG: hypothetical protein HYS13_04350, partial [Planctomycetia bacterium]|nr:hypothetical protein [Planctomycetia bacterium]
HHPVLVLSQFAFRLSFGLAAAMALTSHRHVSSGYFRVHCYVLLGLNVLAASLAFLDRESLPLWPPMVAAALSYVASAIWLYEKPRAGRVALALVAATALAADWLAGTIPSSASTAARILWWLDAPSGGLVLGVTMAAMLLGHWYLNAPGMKLDPLKRLVQGMVLAVAARAVVAGAGLWLFIAAHGTPGLTDGLFLALRWLCGIVGLWLLCWMTWQILKIPNTQSATGVLYVAVIISFIGELTAQLLAAEHGIPL